MSVRSGITAIKDIFSAPADYDGKQITVGGWARSIRSSNAFGFIELNDGTYFSNIQECFSNLEFLILKMIFHCLSL